MTESDAPDVVGMRLVAGSPAAVAAAREAIEMVRDAHDGTLEVSATVQELGYLVFALATYAAAMTLEVCASRAGLTFHDLLDELGPRIVAIASTGTDELAIRRDAARRQPSRPPA